MLEIGTKAPEFSLPDQNGEIRNLADYRGQKVILYFYPKDMTAGCTKQACAFGELFPQFKERYLELKNMHLRQQDDVKSFSIFLETLNEFYQ